MPAPRTLARLAHRLRLRDVADGTLDRVRLTIDTRTARVYQPQAWFGGRRRAARDESSHTRWAAMEPVITEVGAASALDVGCNVGWFMLNIAALGIPAVGVEGDPPALRTVLYAARKSKLPDVGVLAMNVTPRSVTNLPHADCVLLLSVWHHMIDDSGYDAALALLGSIWEHAAKVFFFENGAADVRGRPGVENLEPDATAWFTSLLESACAGGAVRHLGVHDAAGSPRDLFAVVRSGPGAIGD